MTCDRSLPAPPHTASIEQPVSQSSGSGRGACAPSRTGPADHLGTPGKLAGGGFLATGARKGRSSEWLTARQTGPEPAGQALENPDHLLDGAHLGAVDDLPGPV